MACTVNPPQRAPRNGNHTLRHPNVVDVLDLDTDAATDAPYIVQEFLVGDALGG